MTEEQKLERCISLIWDFGKIYDGDDIEQFQNAELSMYSEHDELVKYLEDLKVKAEATKELQEQNLEDCSTFNRKMAETNKAWNEDVYELKQLLKTIIDNAPNTYSGTNIELQQKKMFAFQNAINKAEAFLKE